MAQVGDRIEATSKGGRRAGKVVAVEGVFLTIEWESGEQTRLIPGAGVLTVVPGRKRLTSGGRIGARASAAKAPAKKAPAKKAPAEKAPAAKAPAKKAPAKKAPAKKAPATPAKKAAPAKKAPAKKAPGKGR